MANKKAVISTNNFIAIAVAISLLAVIFSGVVGRSLVKQLLLNNRVIGKKTKVFNQLQANAVAVATLKSNYDQLGGQLQLIDSALPSGPDFPSIVSMLEVIANVSGVRLKIIGPQAGAIVAAESVAAANIPQAYDFSIDAEGSYDSLLKFFGNLEIGARPLKITNIDLSGPTSGQTASIKLTTFYQGQADLTIKTEVVK